ncbi:uncharacterized protein MELLADRAFT_84848 [Melampsora larici-populina 98AG31]|uniref:CxC1-like cysteine cluster associated with KDZ transposases domain-containing protein n=1 Tax=Melampsora larici-populina (strain 98AG31 / pathotype 3-4-7) TaxID=747676 RepID=F4SCP6_MELLP|nr:uncharacterized protein MELLADRAFT_84848 [Melampsora larici-populina 98AG31]EGF97584.1 hypothetical protein MELLADRAFT_84848 [Melampsora larici-populina 98AG31]
MSRFKGKHQTFRPQKPYWLKPPKTPLQKAHFQRMLAAVIANTRRAPPIPHDMANYGDGDLEPLLPEEIADHLPHPDFIDEIYQERIEEERRQHNLLLEQSSQEMFNAYIECHLKTSEWGNPAFWDFDYKPACNCPPSQWRERNIDLIDILFRRKARYPVTAFSIRLLRFYHVVWKYCTTRVGPFARGLDEFLDVFNPLMLTKSDWPREWHTPLSWVIDTYQMMLTMTETALDAELQLTTQDKLAENCPWCFGPPVKSGLILSEPDIIVCLDGNFQHRRHISAGTKAAKTATKMPKLFIPDQQVTEMEQRLSGLSDDDFV